MVNPTHNQQTKGRIQYLDSLRGLAAMIVLWGHFGGGFANPLLPYIQNTPLYIFIDGFAAVSLFFVLSGFVLSINYLTEDSIKERKTPNYLSFCIMRFFRIMVPLLAMMALSYIAMLTLYDPNIKPPIITQWLFSLWENANTMNTVDFFREWGVLFPALSSNLVPQAWTLTIEMTYSLLVPFLILQTQRSSFWLIALTVILLKITNISPFIIHFSLGLLIAKHFVFLSKSIKDSPLILKVLLWGITTVLLTYRSPILTALPELSSTNLWTATGLGSALLILMISSSTKITSILTHRAFVYLGKTSYSLYLCHIVVLIVLTPALLRLLGIDSIAHWSTTLFAFTLSIAISICFADIFHRVIEKPSIKVGKALSSRVNF